MKPVIFLGPSLPVSEAKGILDALYLPPARQADLISAVTTYKPRVIGLIDGVFAQSLSVWHKEILYALEREILVYGASSMGALRAVETAEFGMIGIGEIYGMYSSGELNDDDEVALKHGGEETGYSKLSEPMINVRVTFRLARDKGIINESLCQQLTSIAKSIYYPERTFPGIFKQAAAEGIPEEVRERVKSFVSENYVDAKRQDAILLLETIRDLPDPPPKPVKKVTLQRSRLFNALYQRDRTFRHENVDISGASIANYMALHMADFSELNFHAHNRALVLILADLLEVEVTEEQVDKETKRFRLKHRLKGEEEFTQWLERNTLSHEEFGDLMHEMARFRRLHQWLMIKKFMERSVKMLLDELRVEAKYEEWARKAANQERILAEQYPDFQEKDDTDLRMRALVIDHLRETDLSVDTHYLDWAEEAGFADRADLRIELIRARLVRRFIQELGARAARIEEETSHGGESHSEDQGSQAGQKD